MEEKIFKCVKCGGAPAVIRVDGLVYLQCTCNEWPLYNFMGIRTSCAIDRWNYWNRPINRDPTASNMTVEERYKKKKEHEKEYQRKYYAKKKGREL